MSMRRGAGYGAALLCALLLALAVACSHPLAEMGMNDDWTYVRSARILSSTGHIVYNGWSAPIAGWQLFWGAFFIRLFGFSFLTLRVSMLVIAMATVFLMHRIFERLGLSLRNSTLATLTVAFTPMFFLLSFSFMTDLPGILAILVCLYGCVRAVESRTDRGILAWLAFAAAANVLLGTARQIGWLGVMVILPSTAWLLRRRPHVLATTAALLAASMTAILACMHWFARQPYSVPEKTLAVGFDAPSLVLVADDVVRSVLTIVACCLPVLLALLKPSLLRSQKTKLLLAALGGVAVATLLFRYFPGWLFPFTGNTVSVAGFEDLKTILGQRPRDLPRAVQWSVTAATFTVCFATFLLSKTALSRLRTEKAEAKPGVVTWEALCVLLLPFTVAYALLFATRPIRWDRYLLPLCIVLLVFLLRLCQDRFRSAALLPVASAVLLLAAAFDIAGTHDVFSLYRARLAAAGELKAAGIPSTRFAAGLEYDAWTQIEAQGYINENKIRVPANAWRPWTNPAALPENCYFWFAKMTPAVVPQYALAFPGTSCLKPSEFRAATYTTWLIPAQREVVIGRYR